jgi:hypothetical protein
MISIVSTLLKHTHDETYHVLSSALAFLQRLCTEGSTSGKVGMWLYVRCIDTTLNRTRGGKIEQKGAGS